MGVPVAGMGRRTSWTAMWMWPRPQQLLWAPWNWVGPSDFSQRESTQPGIWYPVLILNEEAWSWMRCLSSARCKQRVLTESDGLPSLPATVIWNLQLEAKIGVLHSLFPLPPKVFSFLPSHIFCSKNFHLLSNFLPYVPVFSMRSPHFTVVLLHGTLSFKIFKPRML